MSNPTYEYFQEIAIEYDYLYIHHAQAKFIHKQEERILAPILKLFPHDKILNLGCGTGRFMEYCQYGVDFSDRMIEQAVLKYPNKDFIIGDAKATGLPSTSFDLIVATNLFAHIPKFAAIAEEAEEDYEEDEEEIIDEEIEELYDEDIEDEIPEYHEDLLAIFQEAHRLLRPNGRFTFNINNLHRPSWLQPSNKDWKALEKYSLSEILDLTAEQWDFIQADAISMLPTHLLPKKIISHFLDIDTILCSNLAAEYATSMFITIQKKED